MKSERNKTIDFSLENGQEYANRVVDYKINGISAREIIAKKSYDIGISNMSSKKSPWLKIQGSR